jgi:hypothetical protein
MTEFNPRIHKIVAVVDQPGQPDHGQQFHLTLPDLIREANDLPVIDWSPIEQRLTAIETAKNSTSTPVMNLAPVISRIDQIEVAVKDLRAGRDTARSTTPLVPISMPVDDARITAIEVTQAELVQHATASTGMADALQAMLQMARDQDERTAKLEAEAAKLKAEAQYTHRVVATALPALNAVLALGR